MVTTEEGVPGENYILTINPLIVIILVVAILSLISQIYVSPPGSERLRRDCNLISKQIIAPFCA